ncbi:MAG TPA: septum formation initiator family protein [Thermoanaerobaculia bacterium]|nr:septum formation initiator family protein [Thermoanaerobaculia bacterium]
MSPTTAPQASRFRTDARPSPPGRLILIALTILIVAAIALGAARSHRDLAAARLRAAALDAQITAAEERIEALERRIERTRDDPATWDRLAREELGLVGAEDIVVLLPEASEN